MPTFIKYFWQKLRAKCLSYLQEIFFFERKRLLLIAASWSFFGQAGTQLLRLISTLVLARLLLSPEAFGLIALVSTFISGLEMLSDFGISQNTIQHRRGEEPCFLSTAFSFQIVRGMVLFLIAAVLAFPFGHFYKEPELGLLIIFSSLAILFRGASNVGAYVSVRQVNIRPLSILTLFAELCGFIVSITWALISPSAWALVVGTVSAAVVYSFGSHFVFNFHLYPKWDKSIAGEIFRFGGWVFIGTATYFLASQGERLYLGKWFTAEELGCFAIAAAIANLPIRFMLHINSYVIFPAIADSLRKNRNSGLQLYIGFRKKFLIVGCLSSVLFIILSGPLVKIILAPQYANVTWILPLLGIRTSLSLIGMLSSSLVLALGQSRYSAFQNIVTLCLILTGLHLSHSMAEKPFMWAMIVLTITPNISSCILLLAIKKLVPELFLIDAKISIGRLFLSATLVTITILLYENSVITN